jgi:uncharacterized protein YciI
MITYNQHIKALSELNASNHFLACLGIKLDHDGNVSTSNFKDQACELIKFLQDSANPFIDQLSNREAVILSLAIKQEEQNAFIDQDQVRSANEFFSFKKPITFDEIQEYNKKFI